MTLSTDPNMEPIAGDDFIVGAYHGLLRINPETLLANDEDQDGDVIRGISLFNAVNGAVFWDGLNVIFVADQGYSGTASFEYGITDDNSNFDTAKVTMNIVPNTLPTAVDDVLVGIANHAVVASADSLLINDYDGNGDVIEGISLQGAVNGAVSWDGTNVTFMPDAGFTGMASYTYTITDHNGGTSTATVNLEIHANAAPVAQDDTVVGEINNQLIISPESLLANDTDRNGDEITGISVQDAANGVVEWDGENVVFTPEAGYVGSASFTYTITDNYGGEDTATVYLDVKQPDVVKPKLFTNNFDEDSSLTVANASIGDLVTDGREITGFTVEGSSRVYDVNVWQDFPTFRNKNDTSAIDIKINADGSYEVRSGNNFYGDLPLIYFISQDAYGEIKTESLSITINPINDAPVEVMGSDNVDVYKNGAQLITTTEDLISQRLSDAEHDEVNVTSVQDGYQGTVSMIDDQIYFKVDEAAEGDASFKYTVNDGNGGEYTGSYYLDIIQDPMLTVKEDVVIVVEPDDKITIPIKGLVENDLDKGLSGRLSVENLSSVQDAVNGTVVIEGDSIVFTPSPGYLGPASFSYTLTKDGISSDTGIVNLVLGEPIDGMTFYAQNDQLGTLNNTLYADFGIFENDMLPSQAYQFEILAAQNAVNGTVSYYNYEQGFGPVPSKKFSFTPNAEYEGPASFEYVIYNKEISGVMSIAKVSFDVEQPLVNPEPEPEVNLAPIAIGETVFMAEQTALIKHNALLRNDVDPESGQLSVLNINNVVGLTTNSVAGGIEVRLNDAPFGSDSPSFQYAVDDSISNPIAPKLSEAPAQVNITVQVDGNFNGTSGADLMFGNADDNVINGNTGNDYILGGAGSDVLTGGAGADVFAWHLAGTSEETIYVDRITDFTVGEDQLNFRDLYEGNFINGADSLDDLLDIAVVGNDTEIEITGFGYEGSQRYTTTTKIILEDVALTPDKDYHFSENLNIVESYRFSFDFEGVLRDF